ncbi:MULTISPECIES: UMP kinase [Archaeoglobus]|jgi:uridylate kinase|uniref:Uridylate kinase n=3 Tax=Archaeoglobus fulgidus TaxID=2234 RepID=PYRH_ARCFU|nr:MULTISPECIES: UMP kinase [Archaeoglobus]O28237.1 RecName: Full=Uridylate kinase; Short=UK; AltName: Full=Uridine monophosphate kinase; Short=UMP kinase; Short=UMPK [Archaeoglobus fulgidus DSM 4304]AAB89213.1 uridylate kinase (pyrH) [Archaeoglobus fulgidus DSM 4304]AIG99032.1 uridylate kinase, putative [Archaeoglobus fulgidus DSM 8774]KUJ92946.1 MAG: Uridylate kinase [Archaeoglobus fulgidus]KUK06425.1 MAG: Uridylate kinase [Archaeoglobus fulgidus]MDI3496933.1 uridylate kinase [Archaeoglobus
MKVVLSLGGSVLSNESEKIREFAKTIESVAQQNQVFVVVGGGKLAREYIKRARELGASETFCDYIGIAATRLNAMLLISAIPSAAKKVPVDFMEAEELSKLYRVVVMGGTFPGHTTDATAALLAEFIKADVFINATNVDGVYSADPKSDTSAVKYDRLSPQQLVEIVSRSSAKAGTNVVIDLLAAKIIERSKIKTYVILGTPENIMKAVKGEAVGTVIA